MALRRQRCAKEERYLPAGFRKAFSDALTVSPTPQTHCRYLQHFLCASNVFPSSPTHSLHFKGITNASNASPPTESERETKLGQRWYVKWDAISVPSRQLISGNIGRSQAAPAQIHCNSLTGSTSPLRPREWYLIPAPSIVPHQSIPLQEADRDTQPEQAHRQETLLRLQRFPYASNALKRSSNVPNASNASLSPPTHPLILPTHLLRLQRVPRNSNTSYMPPTRPRCLRQVPGISSAPPTPQGHSNTFPAASMCSRRLQRVLNASIAFNTSTSPLTCPQHLKRPQCLNECIGAIIAGTGWADVEGPHQLEDNVDLWGCMDIVRDVYVCSLYHFGNKQYQIRKR